MARTPPSSSSNGHLQDDASPQEDAWPAERLVHASYKELGTPAEVEERFYRHLVRSTRCCRSLFRLLQETSSTTRDFSITIDCFELLRNDPVLGQMLLKFPITLKPLLENAIVTAQHHFLRNLQEERPASVPDTTFVQLDSIPVSSLTVKGGSHQLQNPQRDHPRRITTRVHARLVNLPPTSSKASVNDILQASEVNQIVQIAGCVVVRTGPVHMQETTRTYKCAGRQGCQRTFCVHADYEQRHNSLQPPARCPLKKLNSNEVCGSSNIQVVEGGSIHTDYQEIKIQEAAGNGQTNVPRSLLVKLQHDLVDQCHPGDEVVVVGTLIAQWEDSLLPDVECNVSMALSAFSIRVVGEKGESAYWNTNGLGNGGRGQSTVGEMDKYTKEFNAFWESSRLKPYAARDFICRAVCPKLYGLAVIKLALLLTLIGGVPTSESNNDEEVIPQNRTVSLSRDRDDQPEQFHVIQDDSQSPSTRQLFGDSDISSKNQRSKSSAVKTRRRDQSHLLLVGDPGTGKSQFLRFATELCPRSVLTTGVGTTSAGLTCAAVREGSGKEFALEAGALVLADKGVCCIDEFGCICEADRTTIHEAMEQQTLSVAKAGIVCKLNCRATVIAVMNPKRLPYDSHVNLSVNTGLGTPLLSRFDLIFKMIDSSDCERDSNVTTYLLNRAILGTSFVAKKSCGSIETEMWSMDKLRAYIAVVKERFQPLMTDDAVLLLGRHYEKVRSAQGSTIPITVRFLESLIRLSQAHARLMYRDRVLLADAVAVIRVMECSAYAYGGFDGYGTTEGASMYVDPMSIDFAEDPDEDFLVSEYHILNRYDMLDRLDSNKKRKVESLSTISSQEISWKDLEP